MSKNLRSIIPIYQYIKIIVNVIDKNNSSNIKMPTNIYFPIIVFERNNKDAYKNNIRKMIYR